MVHAAIGFLMAAAGPWPRGQVYGSRMGRESIARFLLGSRLFLRAVKCVALLWVLNRKVGARMLRIVHHVSDH
jgi:hypothetical protein